MGSSHTMPFTPPAALRFLLLSEPASWMMLSVHPELAIQVDSWLYFLPVNGESGRVVIVGGGILGTMHAVLARRRGYAVTQLEREPAGRGASVRNFGLVWVSRRRGRGRARARVPAGRIAADRHQRGRAGGDAGGGRAAGRQAAGVRSASRRRGAVRQPGLARGVHGRSALPARRDRRAPGRAAGAARITRRAHVRMAARARG